MTVLAIGAVWVLTSVVAAFAWAAFMRVGSDSGSDKVGSTKAPETMHAARERLPRPAS
jgi:hypothetical protein